MSIFGSSLSQLIWYMDSKKESAVLNVRNAMAELRFNVFSLENSWLKRNPKERYIKDK